MIQRPLWTIPISDKLLQNLKDAGFEYVEDVLCPANKTEVDKITNFRVDFSKLLSRPSTKTALELYKEEVEKDTGIVTFSKALDELFGGGIPTGRVTEIVGAPGTGKTQICLQLCISVLIPQYLGGVCGTAVYIETNNNFSSKRLEEIHAACSSHCEKISIRESHMTPEDTQALRKMIQFNFSQDMIKFSIENWEKLRASLYAVQKMLGQPKNNIRLLIIDSFTFPFYWAEVNLERTKIISEMLNQLNRMAQTHHIAVVVTNELTTCILEGGMKYITPSLGETFAHAVHNRLVLKHETNKKYTALLCKSSEYRQDSVNFEITAGGIRDVSNC